MIPDREHACVTAWPPAIRASRAARFTALQIGWGLFACLLQRFGDGVYGKAEFDLIIAAAIVTVMPGLVMCWNANLVCRQAGKAFAVDDFKTDQLLATGGFTAPEIGQMLRDRFTGGLTSPFALRLELPASPEAPRVASGS